MRASQFLSEYEDLGQEKQNIITTISGLNANDKEHAAILDRIWKLLNTETYNNNITTSLVTTIEDEYMSANAKEIHRLEVAKILSNLDSDYNSMRNFLSKLEKGGVIDISALSQPVSTFNAIFGGDAVAIKAFDALKEYGTGKAQKGPGEFALAMLSNKIRLAQGAGDTEIDGIGKVEVKAATGKTGGRLGHGGSSQEKQMSILNKYRERIPNLIAGIEAKGGGTIGLVPFVNALNAELPTNNAENVKLRKQIAYELISQNLGEYATPIANAFSQEDPDKIQNEYIKQNFEWYKDQDNFDAYLVISFPRGKTAMGRTGDDLIKMRQSGQLLIGSISIIPSKAGQREQFAQVTPSAQGV